MRRSEQVEEEWTTYQPSRIAPSCGFTTSVARPSRPSNGSKEGKQAAHWTRLSCHRFRANEVRLQLSVLAYNLGNLWRRLVLPARIDTWSLTSLQQRLVKTGGRLVKHARYYWLLLAESHLTRRLFGSMLRRIWACRCRRADVQRAPRSRSDEERAQAGRGVREMPQNQVASGTCDA